MRILITGGSSEIGQAIVKRRLEGGDQVFITTSSQESLDKTKQEFADQGLSIDGFVFDLNEPSKCSSELQKVLASGLDALILNAATRQPKLRLFHEMKEEDFSSFFSANTLGQIWLLRAVLPKMLEQKSGRLILISSLIAQSGSSRYSAYAAAKGAMESLFLNLAVDYGSEGVLSSIIRPGIIATSRNRRYMKIPGYVEKLSSMIPQGKIGQPQQIAEALDPFLSANSYLNGSILEVSGGFPKFRSDGAL